jgi:hypothetical protein
MRRLAVVGLLSLGFVSAALVLQPGEAQACSCIASSGPVPAAQDVDVVFTAKLIAVKDAPKQGQFDLAMKIFTFEVTRNFKGQLDGQVNVSTADNSAACGRGYGPVGTEWLIYARIDDSGQIYDNLCSRTRSLEDAAADIAELEANADALDDEPEPSEPPPGPAEPEPEPILPDVADTGADPDADGAPKPTAKPQRCAVIEPTPAGNLAGFLTFGLVLGFVRRRRA